MCDENLGDFADHDLGIVLLVAGLESKLAGGSFCTVNHCSGNHVLTGKSKSERQLGDAYSRESCCPTNHRLETNSFLTRMDLHRWMSRGKLRTCFQTSLSGCLIEPNIDCPTRGRRGHVIWLTRVETANGRSSSVAFPLYTPSTFLAISQWPPHSL